MLSRLWKKKSSSTIGIDRFQGLFYGVRLEQSGQQTRLTHFGQGQTLEELAGSLGKADRVISRPPSGAYYNRRVSYIKSDLRSTSDLKPVERHVVVYFECQRFCPMPVEQTVFGWRLLQYNEASGESVVEIHQSDLESCERQSQVLAKLRLGQPRLDAWHPTVLTPLIPDRFQWHVQQTREPDGFALLKDGHLHGHLSPQALTPGGKHFDRLCSFYEEYKKSGQRGSLQVFFLQRSFRAPKVSGISCSWIGDNCAELLGQGLEENYLQPVGLALGKKPTWWLRHKSTKWLD